MESLNDMAEKKKGVRSWTGRTFGTRLGHFSFFLLARYFNRTFTGIFLIPVVFFYYLFVPGSRSGSSQYFSTVFSSGSFSTGHIRGFLRVFSFARILLDRVFLLVKGQSGFRMEFIDTQYVHDARARGRGVLLLSAHIGSWDIVSRFFKRFNTRVSVVAFEAERPEIRSMYHAHSRQEEAPFDYIYSNDPLDALFKIRNALQRNEIVVMHGDRSSAGKTVYADFLGKKARFPVLPYHIAAKTGCPIVFAFGVRLKKMTYRALAYPPILLPENTAEAIKRGLKEYTSVLEQVIRCYPYQWFNFYDFWENKHA
jgi:predicted LPLAT superfamily acyltransferase